MPNTIKTNPVIIRINPIFLDLINSNSKKESHGPEIPRFTIGLNCFKHLTKLLGVKNSQNIYDSVRNTSDQLTSRITIDVNKFLSSTNTLAQDTLINARHVLASPEINQIGASPMKSQSGIFVERFF